MFNEWFMYMLHMCYFDILYSEFFFCIFRISNVFHKKIITYYILLIYSYTGIFVYEIKFYKHISSRLFCWFKHILLYIYNVYNTQRDILFPLRNIHILCRLHTEYFHLMIEKWTLYILVFSD